MWQKREIENYLCQKEVLMTWVNDTAQEQVGPLLAQEWETTMQETIAEIENALNILGKGSPLPKTDFKVKSALFIVSAIPLITPDDKSSGYSAR
jgi:hypothetical protein